MNMVKIETKDHWLYRFYSKSVISNILRKTIEHAIDTNMVVEFLTPLSMRIIMNREHNSIQLFFNKEQLFKIIDNNTITNYQSWVMMIEKRILEILYTFSKKECDVCLEQTLIRNNYSICNSCIPIIQLNNVIFSKTTVQDVCLICKEINTTPVMFECMNHNACCKCVKTYNNIFQKYTCPLRCTIYADELESGSDNEVNIVASNYDDYFDEHRIMLNDY